MNIRCPHCGSTHPADFRFCPVTAQPLPPPRVRQPRRWRGVVLGGLVIAGVALIGGGIWSWCQDNDECSLLPSFGVASPATPAASPIAHVSLPGATVPPSLSPTTDNPTVAPTSPSTPTPPQPTATPLPTRTPTATSLPTTTRMPTTMPPTATACALRPTGAFASLWSQYQDDLGCPGYAAPRFISDAEQLFQHGHMFWRGDVDVYYVVYDGGGTTQGDWFWFGSKYNEGGLAACTEQAPPGLVKPRSGFGNVWCALGGGDARIGWALDREYGFGAELRTVRVQDFEGGVILQDSDGMRRGLAYVLMYTGQFIRTAP